MKNNKVCIIGILVIVITSLFETSVVFGQNKDTYENTKKLLMTMNSVHSKQLKELFKIGDERIDDLIEALDDPNEKIRINSQRIIRYLGNKDGMNALIKSYEDSENKNFTLTLPIPIPLQDWDYKYLENKFSSVSVNWDIIVRSYIIALSLDGSDKAKSILSDILTSAKQDNINKGIFFDDLLAFDNIYFEENTDLANAVLNEAFFLPPELKRKSSAKLLAFNGNKEMALIEIEVGKGVLAQSWYHTVVKKSEKGWSFFSDSLVALS